MAVSTIADGGAACKYLTLRNRLIWWLGIMLVKYSAKDPSRDSLSIGFQLIQWRAEGCQGNKMVFPPLDPIQRQ